MEEAHVPNVRVHVEPSQSMIFPTSEIKTVRTSDSVMSIYELKEAETSCQDMHVTPMQDSCAPLHPVLSTDPPEGNMEVEENVNEMGHVDQETSCREEGTLHYLKSAQAPQRKPTEIFSCNQCNFVTKWPFILQRHKKTHGSKSDMGSTSRNMFKVISAKVMQKKSFSTGLLCDHCGKTFRSRQGLHSHRKLYIKSNSLECSMCDKKFTTRNHYDGHMNKHASTKCTCTVCGTGFVYPGDLKAHTRTCGKETEPTEDTKVKCDKCDKVFLKKKNLHDHIRGVHQGSQGSRCKRCGRIFRWRSSLSHHMKSAICSTEVSVLPENLALSPLQTKPIAAKLNISLQCNQCDFVADCSFSFERHKEMHESEPYMCSLCGKIFKTKSVGIKHSRICSPVLVCDHCGKTFRSRQGLFSHKKLYAQSNSLECSICDKKFMTRNHYDGHMNKHTSKKCTCTVCGTGFVYPGDLKAHKKTCSGSKKEKEVKTDTKVECDTCGKVFLKKKYLQEHIRGVHQGSQGSRCRKCGKTFKWRSSLSHHLNNAKCSVKDSVLIGNLGVSECSALQSNHDSSIQITPDTPLASQ